jgi:hypothetical protein
MGGALAGEERARVGAGAQRRDGLADDLLSARGRRPGRLGEPVAQLILRLWSSRSRLM